MNRQLKMLVLASALFTTTTVHATGAMTCDSGDKANWQTKEALREKITAEGWEVRKMKVDGGCYEVYATTPKGDRVEAYFDPVSLEKLLVSRRGQVLFEKQN